MKSEDQSIEDINTLRKRLIYRSWHRGTREMDLLMGSFADKYVAGFSPAELEIYGNLLQENDPDLYNWIIGVEKPPANIMSDILEKLMNHAFVKTA